MLHDTSVASTRSSAFEPVSGWWPSLTRKPSTRRPFFSARRLLLVRRVRRDRARPEAGHRGHDLEHRARHVAAERGPRQKRLGGIGLERRECGPGGGRVADRRGVVGRRRGEREDLAGLRIEHHDRAAVLAERRHGGLLEVVRQRQREVLRVVAIGPELGERVGSAGRRPARSARRRRPARDRPGRRGSRHSRRPG